MERFLTSKILHRFAAWLEAGEKSPNTIRKYTRDVVAFAAYQEGAPVTRETVIAYKQKLLEQGYAARSVNSALASLNSLFAFLGWQDCRVKALKLQRQVFCPEEKELTKAEYERLCRAAQNNHNRRLNLILQTICGTGIRVSELQFITAEAVRAGEAVVSLKGKTRAVFLVKSLQKKLLRYITEQNLKSGPVFVTRSGKPMDRTNIWREMKGLCRAANVDPKKVFPHNLRHLFARVFYGIDKDIAKLADILGHSSIETTRLYIISTGQEHRRRMERMHLIL
ncbi:tyrosine-type recombinase/integrase [uncultured Dysosmobacter sp.]|uniref:tyrosine-type recombinase/integrase n=1 Tax=uncultured Dysosmobacter sp. TaxID=2591384 RepID=UPI00263455A5|nr:tyrosine-type recombinase/integrase [uncultured Dysosmobacter sp.]